MSELVTMCERLAEEFIVDATWITTHHMQELTIDTEELDAELVAWAHKNKESMIVLGSFEQVRKMLDAARLLIHKTKELYCKPFGQPVFMWELLMRIILQASQEGDITPQDEDDLNTFLLYALQDQDYNVNAI